MKNSGWIKLHRKARDNPVIMKDGDHLAVWIYILLSVTHKEHDVIFGGKRITLKPGEFTTGRKIISRKLAINESKVERILKLFKSEQQIEQRTDRQCRLIKVINWGKYQLEGTTKGTTSEQRVNNEGTLNNNDKNEKNENNIYIDYVSLTNDEYNKLVEKGGRPITQTNRNNPDGYFGNPNKPKKADSDSDSDSENNIYICILDYFNKLANAKKTLTRERKTKLRARLKVYTEEEIKQAMKSRCTNSWTIENNDVRNIDAVIKNDEIVSHWLDKLDNKDDIKDKKGSLTQDDIDNLTPQERNKIFNNSNS